MIVPTLLEDDCLITITCVEGCGLYDKCPCLTVVVDLEGGLTAVRMKERTQRATACKPLFYVHASLHQTLNSSQYLQISTKTSEINNKENQTEMLLGPDRQKVTALTRKRNVTINFSSRSVNLSVGLKPNELKASLLIRMSCSKVDTWQQSYSGTVSELMHL